MEAGHSLTLIMADSAATIGFFVEGPALGDPLPGDVAQLAEHRLCKAGVESSILFVSTSEVQKAWRAVRPGPRTTCAPSPYVAKMGKAAAVQLTSSDEPA